MYDQKYLRSQSPLECHVLQHPFELPPVVRPFRKRRRVATRSVLQGVRGEEHEVAVPLEVIPPARPPKIRISMTGCRRHLRRHITGHNSFDQMLGVRARLAARICQSLGLRASGRVSIPNALVVRTIPE